MDAFETLGLSPDADEEEVLAAYRRLTIAAHPDTGGSDETWIELVRARDEALARARKKTAGTIIRYQPFPAAEYSRLQAEREEHREAFEAVRRKALLKVVSPLSRIRTALALLTAVAGLLALAMSQHFPLFGEPASDDPVSVDTTALVDADLNDAMGHQAYLIRTGFSGHTSDIGSLNLVARQGDKEKLLGLAEAMAPLQELLKSQEAPESAIKDVWIFNQTELGDLNAMHPITSNLVPDCLRKYGEKPAPDTKTACVRLASDRLASGLPTVFGNLSHNLKADFLRENIRRKFALQSLHRQETQYAALLFFAALIIGAVAGALQFYLRIAQDRMQWLESQLTNRRSISLLISELFGSESDRRWTTKDLEDMVEQQLSKHGAKVIDQGDLTMIRAYVSQYYGLSDFVEMILAKGLQMDLFEKETFKNDSEDYYRIRRPS